MKYVGTHLIIDLWTERNLDDSIYVESVLKDCVEKIGATLLDSHIHKFNPTGVTGVLLLEESHISIHTWPEYNYAAIDIFTCRDIEADNAIEVLKKSFNPTKIQIQKIQRGKI